MLILLYFAVDDKIFLSKIIKNKKIPPDHHGVEGKMRVKFGITNICFGYIPQRLSTMC